MLLCNCPHAVIIVVLAEVLRLRDGRCCRWWQLLPLTVKLCARVGYNCEIVNVQIMNITYVQRRERERDGLTQSIVGDQL